MPPYLEYTMSKPQSPRSRPAAAKAGEGRDGRSFFAPEGRGPRHGRAFRAARRASGPDGGRGGHAEPRARRDAPAGRRDDGRAPAAANTAATSARTVVANTKAIVSTPARIAASKAAVARARALMVAMSGRAMPTVARLRAARKDAGNTPAMIVRMRAGNMPAALARTAAGSRAVTIASRIAVVNTTTTAATAVRRTPGIRPGRPPRWPFRRASRAGPCRSGR